ncbi:protein OSCP1a [Sinocyclocheilus grahami]|uniref:Protein OSCP1-like n=1 Tax=Sinocyclocheilus grahami TaxID=75366 RepID=A0A672RIE5_SINGR|nr:PREDICTED: protein OSCP1-like [Sinocyclocheilus grahami]XP_016088982.1 PREDICTED: protein OSCP1-like [Sinocyclocheilus grahami]XP_016088983.1 PREDICTED: protein OSCP1-like [Sinocyclocheilus grahami]
MSQRTLPLLIINLGGEMIYILDQRLRAQDDNDDKTQRGRWTDDDRKRVMNDIVATMFNKAFLEELLRPQDLYSHRALRTVLTRLAHASIMRLNPLSMDKLYDLMTMAFKYQIVLCPRPQDLLLITFNHTDTIKELVKDNPSLVNQINEAQRQLIEVYTPLSDGEFQLIRHTLLVLFQDMQIRVSIFLKEKIQNPNGHFVLQTSGPVPYGFEVPGLIRYFNAKGREVRRTRFPSGGSYTSAVRQGSFDLSGDRVTFLGTNMYNTPSPEEMDPSTTSNSTRKPKQADTTPNPLATEELNLLAKLMGGMEMEKILNVDAGFKVNLLASDQEEEGIGISEETAHQSSRVINIQATQDQLASTELARIAGEFDEGGSLTEGSGNKGDDLLAMMDEL